MKTVISTMSLMALMLAALTAGCATQTEETVTEPEAAPEAKQEAPPPAVTESAPQTTAPTQTMSYLVQRGDNLWNIAGQTDIYNNPYHWPLIYRANQSKISDADLIHPGQDLSIDRNASSVDISAAVTHAKTRGAWSLGVTEESDKAYLAR